MPEDTHTPVYDKYTYASFLQEQLPRGLMPSSSELAYKPLLYIFNKYFTDLNIRCDFK